MTRLIISRVGNDSRTHMCANEVCSPLARQKRERGAGVTSAPRALLVFRSRPVRYGDLDRRHTTCESVCRGG